MRFRITFTEPREPEVVEADGAEVKASNGQIVLRRTVMVAGQPRQVVVRRYTAGEVESVDEIAGCGHRHPCPRRQP